MAVAPTESAMRHAERANDSEISADLVRSILVCNTRSRYSGDASTVLAIRSIVLTDSIGNAPDAVSPESITESAPSKIAFATSVNSARVGREFWIIESSICVATMTARFALFAFTAIRFCTRGTCSVGS